MTESPRLKCAYCGHEDSLSCPAAVGVFTCDECGTRIAFGIPLVRATINPDAEDKRFLRVRFAWGTKANPNEVEFALDREYAADIAGELLSVSSPQKWAALSAMLSVVRDRPGASERGDAVTALDGLPRNPGSAAGAPLRDDAGALVKCQCGKPASRKNGSCQECFLAALGG
jgi:hypothetical protein